MRGLILPPGFPPYQHLLPITHHVCCTGARGIEPLNAGLEAAVLPLNYAPIFILDENLPVPPYALHLLLCVEGVEPSPSRV